MVEMIPIVGLLTSTVMVIAVVYLVTRARQRRVELQVEMQSKLIDRFGSAPELVEFLHSPAGRQFISGVQTAPAVLTRERILSGFTRAIVLTFLSLAFVFLTFWVDDSFGIPAAILLSLGLGYLAATVLSYKLSDKLQIGTVEQL